jgi:hypothetical protein
MHTGCVSLEGGGFVGLASEAACEASGGDSAGSGQTEARWLEGTAACDSAGQGGAALWVALVVALVLRWT